MTFDLDCTTAAEADVKVRSIHTIYEYDLLT